MHFAPEEREAYEAHLKWLRVEANTLKKYEAKGYDEGLERGERIGLEKSERKLEEEKRRMIHMMLQEGMDIQKISKITRISIEEIFKGNEHSR